MTSDQFATIFNHINSDQNATKFVGQEWTFTFGKLTDALELAGVPVVPAEQPFVNPSRVLVLMCGLPRSGKSTLARQLGFPIVSPDAIRLALHGQRFNPQMEPYVWAIATTMVDALFRAGHANVVVDATHVTRAKREFWNSTQWETKIYHVPTSEEVCLLRADDLDDEEIKPVIWRMAAQFEPLGDDEKQWIPAE